MNKVILLGRLVKDVDVKYTNNNTRVSRFTLAVNRRIKNEQQTADFFNVVAFGKLSEFCSNYFKKGQQVSIIGTLQNRSWDKEDGTKGYLTEVIASELYFADSKKDNSSVNGGMEDLPW